MENIIGMDKSNLTNLVKDIAKEVSERYSNINHIHTDLLGSISIDKGILDLGTSGSEVSVIPIEKGGTGSNNVKDALVNLGAATSVHYHSQYLVYQNVPNNTNFNNLACGTISFQDIGGGSGANGPLSSGFYVIATLGLPTRTAQIATSVYAGQQGTWIRYKHDSDWSGWTKFTTSGYTYLSNEIGITQDEVNLDIDYRLSCIELGI